MSLILDALRKIELERKAKRQNCQELRNEVLHYRGAVPSVEKSRAIPVIAALLLMSAAAVGFFYFTSPEPLKIAATRPKETVPQELPPAVPPQAVQSAPLTLPLDKSLPAEVKNSPPLVKQPAETVTVQQKSSDDRINVSGIAWQDERSLRRAVINGHLVGEGAEIEGAKIIEIKENRVKFSRGGEIFEVGHSSGMSKP